MLEAIAASIQATDDIDLPGSRRVLGSILNTIILGKLRSCSHLKELIDMKPDATGKVVGIRDRLMVSDSDRLSEDEKLNVALTIKHLFTVYCPAINLVMFEAADLSKMFNLVVDGLVSNRPIVHFYVLVNTAVPLLVVGSLDEIRQDIQIRKNALLNELPLAGSSNVSPFAAAPQNSSSNTGRVPYHQRGGRGRGYQRREPRRSRSPDRYRDRSPDRRDRRARSPSRERRDSDRHSDRDRDRGRDVRRTNEPSGSSSGAARPTA